MEDLQTTTALKNGDVVDSKTSDCCPKDIEAEADSYFRQLFSGQLTVDTMIQTLVRFKNSSEKREHSILEYMIVNFFKDYRFFSKYPAKQLHIAAVLFGSLIKHHVITKLTRGVPNKEVTLGGALRAVLVALLKPANPKMFVFGTKALEQYVDRLVEWPLYTYIILRIAHLRETHPELVASIEQRISSAVQDTSSDYFLLSQLERMSSYHQNNPNGNNIACYPLRSYNLIPALSEGIEDLQTTTALKNGDVVDSKTSDCFPKDIEAEADSYFRQLFSGQLTVDTMIQTLVRFKNSSEKREHSILEYMIVNFFKDYRFFSKYPAKQLHIAAVLFGSLIKHHVITKLTLGVPNKEVTLGGALRAVLVALLRPADSKMYVFGTKALEQYVDRLVEWPLYTYTILRIAHLRETHPELVASIEQRISSAIENTSSYQQNWNNIASSGLH